MRRVLAMAAMLAALPASSCDDGPGKVKAVECRADDDCDASELGICDTASCVEGRCELGSQPDGHRCDDSDPLTGGDACVSGICAGIAKACEDDLGPCLVAVHDPVTDECVVEPVENDAPCDDANACTQADSCQAGECVGAEPKTCAALDDCHVEGECDPESGACVDVSAPDGTACDDGQSCTVSDSCTEGACTGEAVVCDDGLGCSVDSCDAASGACASDVSQCSCVRDQDCSDGNACNGAEVCDPESKLCRLGTPVICGANADACLKNVCLPETGACVPESMPNGTACDDASACTQRDTCQTGVCVGSDAVVCTALSQCHSAGVCDASTGHCTNPERANNAVCNDGNACTVTDRCQAGSCVGSGQVTCQASDQCHDAGVCNAKTGACSNPNRQDGVSCNDGNACTKGDACQAGSCTSSNQVVCSALDTCHAVGVCDAATGVCSNPPKANGAACNDGQICTTGDKCVGGSCTGTATVCNDNVVCTQDTCSEQLGGCTVNSTNCGCKTSADCNDNNPCNGVEQCNLQTLQCQPGTPVDCSTFNDTCNIGVCNVNSGSCQASPRQDGTVCDDGNLCSAASSCQAGVCKGTSVTVCTASDQCHDAGACNPSTGKCSNPAKNNGSTCNDGSACTKTDSCQGGVCTGASPVVCPASDDCHEAGVCVPSTGSCTYLAKTNGSGCSDGNACTQTDTCQGGVCLGASPVTCSASDQCHTAGTCEPSTGKCTNPAKTDGAGCSDNTLCTQTDTCQAGVCTGSSPVTCTASDQCHTVGTCVAATGKCTNPAKVNGTACVDTSACTQTDTCQGGSCVGANPIVCPAPDQCHDAGTCDAATGTCSNPAKTDSTPCNDAKACTSGDKCTKGVCGGGTVACNDGIACTVDSCQEPSGCNYDRSQCGCAKDADCNDGNACNGIETCNLGTLSCMAGTAVSCGGLDDACNVGVCDGKTGACKATPRTDGTGCDDGNACTKVDACTAGKCVGSSTVNCTALDQCHDVGTCDTKTGVCSQPNKTNGSGCNDGNACTQTDSCQTGVCTGANPVTCTAQSQCHNVGSCDTQTGQCSNPVRTGACNDGNKCTQTDACSAGVCVGSNPVVCAASDQCHNAGTCVSATGVCSDPPKTDGTKCDDQDACTVTDTCQGGACKSGTPKTCGQLDQCYKVGVCDPKDGQCSNPFADTTTGCNDGNQCTSGEKCDGKGGCGKGSPVVCQPPANPCKTNTCDVAVGCQLGDQPIGWSCDDSSECTQLDQCAKGGVCKGGDPRANVNGDWSDDPGSGDAGPTSVDIFTDKEGNAHIVGAYSGEIRFNDKEDSKAFTVLALPGKQVNGVYWAIYKESGEVASAFNIAAGASTLTVAHAAGHANGSFTLLGVFRGKAVFGRNGTVTKPLEALNEQIYVAHYQANGVIEWVAHFDPAKGVTFSAVSIAAFDDDSVIATGDGAGDITFNDANGKEPITVKGTGVWAARLDREGNRQWARLVASPLQGIINQHSVTTLDDGGAALTGTFSYRAALGPGAEVAVTTAGGDNGALDVWYMKLDKESSLKWGGRVGAVGEDHAGDVARIPGGGALLLATTFGEGPNASDAKTSQPLFSTNASSLQTHVIHLDNAGEMLSAGLIASPEGGSARGYGLELDPIKGYSVAGVFTKNTRFYNKVGFGSGTPPVAPKITLASLYNGQHTLFAARVDAGGSFPWAAQAGGDNSGMTTAPWDIVLAGHASRSVTVAGMFRSTAIFGDRVTEQLQAYEKVGNPFVVHLNSEAEYDYCP